MKSHTTLAVVIVLAHAATAHAKDPALQSLTMEHFRDTATVTDNPSQETATVSTENGFIEHTGLMRMVWNDEFLQGVIDKKNGQKTLQVTAWIIYSGAWRSYETASYRTPDGMRSVPVTRIGKEVANCAVGDCTYTERITFPIDEEFLRGLAARRVPGKPAIWSFQLTAKSAPAFSGGISDAEAAGFIARLDEYANPLPAVKANTASAALKLDLGVGGMAVDPGEDTPRRAGVLIVAVDRSSVARKAGIIVGDIVYEFDGRPISTLMDLQTAVAGCAANSSVTVKLFRGTDERELHAQVGDFR